MEQELEEVERRFPLNDHAMAFLETGPQFFELLDDVPIDEDIPGQLGHH